MPIWRGAGGAWEASAGVAGAAGGGSDAGALADGSATALGTAVLVATPVAALAEKGIVSPVGLAAAAALCAAPVWRWTITYRAPASTLVSPRRPAKPSAANSPARLRPDGVAPAREVAHGSAELAYAPPGAATVCAEGEGADGAGAANGCGPIGMLAVTRNGKIRFAFWNARAPTSVANGTSAAPSSVTDEKRSLGFRRRHPRTARSSSGGTAPSGLRARGLIGSDS